MNKQVDFEKVVQFGFAVAELRAEFPEFAREIDKMHFDVGKKFFPSCGHEKCDCQMTFEQFHAGRNRFFENLARAEKQ